MKQEQSGGNSMTVAGPERITAVVSNAASEARSPLEVLGSTHPLMREFGRLEASVINISATIDSTVEDPNSPVQRTAKGAVVAEGVSVRHLTHQNMEGSLYCTDTDSGATVRFRWGGLGGDKHVYLYDKDIKKEFLFVDIEKTKDSMKITARRLDGDFIVSMEAGGARICTWQENSDYQKAKHEAEQEFRNRKPPTHTFSEYASHALNAVTFGLFGKMIHDPVVEPPAPIPLPGKVVPYDNLSQNFSKMVSILERAAVALTPEPEAAVA